MILINYMYFDMIRWQGSYSTYLNEIFEMNMRALKGKSQRKFYEVLKEYPIVKYEYNCDGKFTRKSITSKF